MPVSKEKKKSTPHGESTAPKGIKSGKAAKKNSFRSLSLDEGRALADRFFPLPK